MERVGPYIIEGELGRGGMGVVYRARHEELDRPVALKVIGGGVGSTAVTAETLADPAPGAIPETLSREQMLLARFRREAQAAGRLAGHPGIVGVHDVGIHPAHNTLYLAMELVEGRTLDDVIQEGDLSAEEAARLFARIAEAVHHAHTHGVLHRDLKPGNVLITPDGQPKVTDFGLAKSTEASPEVTRLTQAGELVGTPAYMAPEQVRGLGVDARTDVYALGIALYETLAGRCPFEGDSVYTVVAQVVRDDPPPLRSIAPHVPAALEAIVETCIEKSPERRYATAAELAADLERFRAGEAVHARRRSAAGRWWRRQGRWVAAAVALAAAGGGTAWWIAARHAASSRQDRKVIDSTQRERTQAERAAELSNHWLAMSQAAVPSIRALQDHFYGAAAAPEKLAGAVAAVRRAAEASGDATTPPGWVALAEFYARRPGAWERLQQLAQGAPEDPLLQVLAAHAALAGYGESLKMPGTEFTADQSVMDGYVETAGMVQWRDRAAVILRRAEGSPLWPLLTQAEAVVAYARAGGAMTRGEFAAAAAELAPLADDPLFGDEAAALAAFAHLHADDAAAAAAAWERVGRRGWTAALHRGSLARIMVATQASNRGQNPIPHMEQALALARAAESLHPEDPLRIAQVGMVQFGMALQRAARGEDDLPDLEASVATYDRAAKAGPIGAGTLLNMAGARRTWAKARANRGFDPRRELRTALHDLAQGLTLDPEWNSARVVLGNIWVDLAKFEMAFGGDPFPAFEQAHAAFTSVLEKHPRVVGALLGQASCWRIQAEAEYLAGRSSRQSIEQGLAAVKRALVEQPASYDALSTGALMWKMQGDSLREAGEDPVAAFTESLTLFAAALERRPNNFRLLNNRALTHRSIGDAKRLGGGGGDCVPHYRDAIADLTAALKVMPDHPVPLYNLAVNHYLCAGVLLERGEDPGPDRAASLQAYNAVVEQNPRMWQALLGRANLYRHMGLRAEAVADYEATLRVNGKIDEARRAIRELREGR